MPFRAYQRKDIDSIRELRGLRRLLDEAGVALLPGSAFGRDPEELTVRLAVVDFDGARAMAALEGCAPGSEVGREFLETHCRGALDAMRRIHGWTRGAARDASALREAGRGLEPTLASVPRQST